MINPSPENSDREQLSNEEIDTMLLEADEIPEDYFRLRAKALVSIAKKFGKRRSEIATSARKTAIHFYPSQKTQFIYPVTLRTQQKAHSVKLLKGFITGNPGCVLAKGCSFCRETPRLIAVNYANLCLALFGCYKADCNNKLIRVNTA